MKRPLPFHSNAVWPPVLLVVPFVFIYGLIVICLWSLARSTHGGLRLDDTGEIIYVRTTILAGFAGLFAAFRLFRFHPACNQPYAAWLKLSPWTAAKPLPLGPVGLVWQDAAVIGLLTAIVYWHAHGDALWPVFVFGLVYLLGMTILLAVTRQWWNCWALGYLWPALMLPISSAPARYAIVVAILLVIWHGHRQSLKAFPWKFVKDMDRPPQSILQVRIQIGPASQSKLGWPIDALSPKIKAPSVSKLENLAISTLMGWWTFCVIQATAMDPIPEGILLFAFVAAGLRMAIYGSNVTPPVNLWGRIASGRIIMPGYDQVFLTPLAVVLTALLGAIIIKRSGVWYPVTESCVVALLCSLLLGGGPRLRAWLLTGEHRFRPSKRQANNRQILRPI